MRRRLHTWGTRLLVMGSASFVNDDEFLSAGWQATPWSECSEPANETTVLPEVPQGCTAGTQRRAVTCDPDGLPCQGPTPSTSRVCVTGEVCGWAVGGWSACSVSCGERGVQRRHAICLSRSLPGSCPEYPFSLSRECIGTVGCEWWRSEWGECSASCGSGVQHRSVACRDAAGCSGLPPARTQPCRGTSCSWYSGTWSACDGRSCGASGFQHREVRCEHEDDCLGQEPASSQSCTVTVGCQFLSPATTDAAGRRTALALTTTSAGGLDSNDAQATTTTPPEASTTVPEYSYFVGHWTACDSDCGLGTKTREVFCIRTCSVYRCPEVAQWWCDSLGALKPPDVLGCYGPPPPCTTTDGVGAPSTSTSQPPSGGPAGTSPTTTTRARGSILSPSDVECVSAPGTVAIGSCLQAGPTLCGATCPCCRVRQGLQLLPARPAPSVTVNTGSDESDSPSIGWTVAVVGSSCAGTCLLLGIVYAAWHVTKKSTYEVTQSPPPSNKDRPPGPRPGQTVQSSRSVPEAWPGPDGFQDWYDDEIPEAFREPPKVDVERPTRREGSRRRSKAGEGGGGRGFTQEDAESSEEANYVRSTPSRRREAASAAADAFAAAGEAPEDGSANQDSGTRPERKSGGTPEPTSGPRASGSTSRPRAATGPPTPPRGKRPADSEDDASAREATAGAGAGRAGGAEPRGAGAGAGASKPAGGESEAKPAVGSAAAPSAEAAGIIAKIDAELDSTRDKELEWRRRHFRELMLRWHPDKNRKESPEQAAEVFRHVMARRGGYLDA